MSSTPSFTFSDLFAGIGGFHAALHAAGGNWVFSSEIDPDAQRVYDYNWLRPLREAAATAEEASTIRVSGDIVPLTDPEVTVPHADVLAAGFPCQPFSKSGFQRGMDETRGTLFWNIARILQDERARPSVVLLENVRNLAGPRHRDTTFKTIVDTLRELGYRTASHPAILSPHQLSRSVGGRPQVRERVFILAHYVGRAAAQDPTNFDDPIVTPKAFEAAGRGERWDLAADLPLEPEGQVDPRYRLSADEVTWIQTWDALLSHVAARLEDGEMLPGFPIWSDDFRTCDEAESLISRLELENGPLAGWKKSFLRKNAEFYERHREVLDDFLPQIRTFPPSRRKFEWQAGPFRPYSQMIYHFRPSGIRCKRASHVPALVAITQTTVLGSRLRRLTPRETARLQGFPDSFVFESERELVGRVAQRDAASFKQVGNAVNVGAAYYVFRQYVLRHRDEIPTNIVESVLQSPSAPPEDRPEELAFSSVILEQDEVEMEELTSERHAEDGFVPAVDKLEAVNRISRAVGGPVEKLGTGSKERKSVFVSVAKQLAYRTPDLSLTKPQLAERLTVDLGGEWDTGCWSRGSTVTLEGLNALLKGVEAKFGVPDRSTRRLEDIWAEGREIARLVTRCTPRVVDGRDAVTEMRLAGSKDWAKTEWPGFYFEFCNLGYLMAELNGGPCTTRNKNCVLDLKARGVWDLGAHRRGVKWAILNDKLGIDSTLADHGGVGFVILTADMQFDEEFAEWFAALRLEHGKQPRPRKGEPRYNRRQKSKVTARRVDVFYFTDGDWAAAQQQGAVREWVPGRQPGGQARNVKYQLAPGNAQQWLVASGEW